MTSTSCRAYIQLSIQQTHSSIYNILFIKRHNITKEHHVASSTPHMYFQHDLHTCCAIRMTSLYIIYISLRPLNNSQLFIVKTLFTRSTLP